MTKILDLLKIGAMQFIQYGLAGLSYLALAAHSYRGVIIMDIIFALNSFTLIHKIVENKNMAARLAFVTGGVLGSVVALWLDLNIFHMK